MEATRGEDTRHIGIFYNDELHSYSEDEYVKCSNSGPRPSHVQTMTDISCRFKTHLWTQNLLVC